MPLQTGQVLHNRYRIVKLLGQGGFGAVYRAWDANLSRPCAVKENLDTSPEAQRQFTREATVLANLSHPNLPRVTDHFILPGQGQYLVMDFVDGDDLASLVHKQGTPPLEQVLVWVSQVADALTYLHSRQPAVVHRDIKPSNIRITPDGRAMLVDFGLVKVYDPHLRTTSGARAVTPGYAPPEQYGQGSTDARTDIYALGATIYNLLTGQEPLESVQRMVGRQMQLAHQVNPRVPLHVSMAIDKAMKLEPSQRFQNATEFYNALIASAPPQQVVVKPGAEAYARPATAVAGTPAARPGTQVAPPPRGTAVPRPASEPRPARKTGGYTAWAGVAVLVLLCLGGAFLFSAWAVRENQRIAKQTEDARIQATMAARVEATSTAQAHQTATVAVQQTAAARATATAAVQVTATAQVIATEQSLQTYIQNLEANKVSIFGPSSGSLKHDPEDSHIKAEQAEVNIRDFIVEARFYNPYPETTGSWDYGYILRHEKANTQFRFVIRSDSTWVFTNHVGDADGTVIAEGEFTNLDKSESGSNLLKLIFRGDRGFIFLNGIYIGELDLTSRMNAGSIFIGTGFYTGDEVANASTNYENFTIWSIP